MDNLCHTLAGAALAEAGLRQSSRFATAALLVASNLPDVDALAFFGDLPSVAFRRGWTHGILAQALLPVLLTGALAALDRWRPPRSGDARRVRPLPLLALAYAGVLLHVGMDWLNNYGIRLLMPFSGRWFYGDAVFIIDPWLWLALGLGVIVARRRMSRRPARIAVGLASLYVALMIAASFAARARVAAAWTAVNGRRPEAVMVGPVPVHPFRKTVIVDAGGYYERGAYDWLPRPRVRFEPGRVPRNDRHPAAALARLEPDFRALLVWSRFPYYEIEPGAGGVQVTLKDMRFGDRGIFAARTMVPLADGGDGAHGSSERSNGATGDNGQDSGARDAPPPDPPPWTSLSPLLRFRDP